jgi:hypothetical protein
MLDSGALRADSRGRGNDAGKIKQTGREACGCYAVLIKKIILELNQ